MRLKSFVVVGLACALSCSLSGCYLLLMDGGTDAKPCPPAQEKCSKDSDSRALTQR
ncbi:MAG TPA: hypothetical protein VG839_08830 [Asticcacaulis sp.]|nr:hypothetical protein [Asticcacaulis sp.]